jgi:CcmD family protein
MRLPLLCLLLIGLAPLPARAQEPPAAQTEAAVVEGQAVPSVGAPVPAQSSGLPTAPTPPRTMRAYWHVFVAFAIAWALLFGYVVVLGRRFGSLEREIKRLEGTGV